MGKIITLIGITEFPSPNVVGINLAVAIRGQTKSDSVFIDCSLCGVDEFQTLLGNSSSKSLQDLIPIAASGASGLLRGYLTEFKPGVTVVRGIDSEQTLNPANISSIMQLLSSTYAHTIVTAPDKHDEYMYALIDNSDLILVLIAPDLLSMQKAKQFLERIQSWHLPFDLIKPVLMQIEGVTSYLSERDSNVFLGIPVFQTIAFEPQTIINLLNSGELPVISAPHTNFSKDIIALASRLSKEATFPNIKKIYGAPNGQTKAYDKEANPSFQEIKDRIHKTIISELNAQQIKIDTLSSGEAAERLKGKTRHLIEELLSKEPSLSREERAHLVDEILNEVLGLGCIEAYLHDPEVTEIMVNGPERIYIEKKGKIQLTDVRFPSSSQLHTVIDRIVTPIGRRVDESSPLVDARLADGSRVNVIIPPVALEGPALTIRKFSKNKLTIDDLIAADALNRAMADFLKVCVQMRRNIVISGGTGSGKTTLLNVVSSFIPSDERIITIEDSAELRLPQEHVVRLESRRASVEGTGEVSIRHLVTNALRMRPDRIIIGECRAAETLDMLQAMNTGHDGSLTTIHANSPRDAIGRIATMVLMAGTELPERAIREQIASAIHIIVQLSRLSDGTRKVIEISEVKTDKGGAIELIPIFTFNRKGIADGKIAGTFIAAGNLPSFAGEAASHGITIDQSVFSRGIL